MKKKNTTIGVSLERKEEEDKNPKLPPIYVLDEHKSEVVYSDLLQRLTIFISNIKDNSGMWREHVLLL